MSSCQRLKKSKPSAVMMPARLSMALVLTRYLAKFLSRFVMGSFGFVVHVVFWCVCL